MAKIGLIDVDSHNFPNLALMRISTYHKQRGDQVEWWFGDMKHYDVVYKNLFRIKSLDELGFDPYVMIYDKPNATREVRALQRWCNNKRIFRTCRRFEDYKP